METKNFNIIKDKIKELNDIKDNIDLYEWNNTDDEYKCANFNSVDEMREFENRVLNGEFDFIFNNDFLDNINDMYEIIEKCNYTKDNINFYVYTYQKDNDFITYMAITNLETETTLDNLYGFKTNDEKEARDYFKKLVDDLQNNTLEYIFEQIVIDIEKNIKIYKNKYEELTTKS